MRARIRYLIFARGGRVWGGGLYTFIFANRWPSLRGGLSAILFDKGEMVAKSEKVAFVRFL